MLMGQLGLRQKQYQPEVKKWEGVIDKDRVMMPGIIER